MGGGGRKKRDGSVFIAGAVKNNNPAELAFQWAGFSLFFRCVLLPRGAASLRCLSLTSAFWGGLFVGSDIFKGLKRSRPPFQMLKLIFSWSPGCLRGGDGEIQPHMHFMDSPRLSPLTTLPVSLDRGTFTAH